MSPEDIALINPNTKTCPVFRSQADAELTKKIYRRVPVLIDETRGEAGNPWGMIFRQGLFNMTSDSGLFRRHAKLRDAGGRLEEMVWSLPNGERWLPLYEAKMIHHFDHRWAMYEVDGESAHDASEAEKQDPVFRPMPRYWVLDREVEARLKDKGWTRGWLFGWRDICRSTDERTVIASTIPRVGVGNKIPLLLVSREFEPSVVIGLIGNLASMVLDYVARQKIGGTTLNFFYMRQLPVLAPIAYAERDRDFIIPRVLELSYTAWDMQPLAKDLGYQGEPFKWDPERRALLRAELDAYYAYLYGLSKKELRYILDPKDVMGEDYPSETFRVLKEREIKEHGLDERGMWRTQRLVLDAYDRFAKDGIFDPARLEDPEYFPVVRAALKVSKSREQDLERTLAQLVARTDQTALPTLFVEGATDKLILEGAWRALFPDKPSPVSVLSAGGTMQMKSLAAPGTAMQQLLGDRLVLALADNDGPGRELAPHKELHGGGEWIKQTNGTHWCLLAPTDEFRAAMERFKIPATFWPFTIENAFPAALRRQAATEGAYAFSGDLQAELLRDPGVAKRAFQAFKEIDADDDAYFHLMAPTYEAKDAFAAWVADPARLTPTNFAAFGLVLNGLKDLLAQPRANGGQPPQQRRSA